MVPCDCIRNRRDCPCDCIRNGLFSVFIMSKNLGFLELLHTQSQRQSHVPVIAYAIAETVAPCCTRGSGVHFRRTQCTFAETVARVFLLFLRLPEAPFVRTPYSDAQYFQRIYFQGDLLSRSPACADRTDGVPRGAPWPWGPGPMAAAFGCGLRPRPPAAAFGHGLRPWPTVAVCGWS